MLGLNMSLMARPPFMRGIAQAIQSLFKFTGTTTTNLDGSRELVNSGTGENALMKTGVTLNTSANRYFTNGARAFNGDRVFRAYVNVPDSAESEAYGVGDSGSYSFRFGKSSINNQWYFAYGFEGLGKLLYVQREKTDAVLLMSIDSVAQVADCYIDGIFVGSIDASLETPSSSTYSIYVGAFNRAVLYDFVGDIGFTWTVLGVKITDPQQVMDDYLYPEKTFYRNEDGSIGSDVFTDPAELAKINDGSNDRGFAFPISETSGNQVRDIFKNSNYTIANYVDDTIYTTGLSKDYQNALVATDTTNHYQRNYDFEEIAANSFAELPLILNVSTYSFAEEAPDGDLVLTLLYPPAQRNPLQTEWYVSPTGSNYTGTGQSDSPLKDLNAIKYILDIYEGDTATAPLTFYLMDGEYEPQFLYRTNFQNTTVKIDPAATADVIVNKLYLESCTNLVIDGQTQANLGLNAKYRDSVNDFGIVVRKPLSEIDPITSNIDYSLIVTAGDYIPNDSIIIKNLYLTGLADHTVESYDDWTLPEQMHNVYARAFRGFGIENAHNSTFENNFVEGCGSFMSIDKNDNLSIIGNECSRWFLDGITLAGDLPNLVIANNYIHDVYEVTGVHTDHIQSFGGVNGAIMTNLLIANNVLVRAVDTASFYKAANPNYVHIKTGDNPDANGRIIDGANAGFGDDASGVGGYTDEFGYLRNVNDEYYIRTGYAVQGMFHEGTLVGGKIINNVVYPSNSVYGIATPVHSTDLLVAHNTTIASRIKTPLSTANNVTIANNACAIEVQGNTIAEVTLDNNYTSLTASDMVDADFTDGNFDLQLVANITGSSAYLADVPDDINGTTRANPPSVGAYEYVV